MSRANIIQQAEQMIKEYHQDLLQPDHKWPADIRRGLEFLNNELFKTGCNIYSFKQKNGTPQNNYSSRFGRYVGMPPRDYMIHHRVELAKRLLCEHIFRTLSIGEVGWLVGYEKLQSFSTIFKSKTNLPPGKWRRRQLIHDKDEEKNEEKF